MLRIIIAAVAAGGAAIAALYFLGPDIGTQEVGAHVAAESAAAGIGTEEEGAHVAIGTEEIGANVAAESAAADGDAAFIYTRDIDFFGYYMPTAPIVAGPWRLDLVFIGDATMFDEFAEAGDPADMAPVWMDFSHAESETAINEMGQEYALVTRRVRADAFTLEAGRFDFRGSDDEIGDIWLFGAIDASLIGARDGVSGDAEVLTADLEIGGQRFSNVSFWHYPGD